MELLIHSAGMCSELDEAKALAELVKKGYNLKRTVVYCAWDGEEPFLGPTEWTEYHADELKKKAVMYLNTDGNSRGFCRSSRIPYTRIIFNEIADQVIDPQTNVTVKRTKIC